MVCDGKALSVDGESAVGLLPSSAVSNSLVQQSLPSAMAFCQALERTFPVLTKETNKSKSSTQQPHKHTEELSKQILGEQKGTKSSSLTAADLPKRSF